METDSYEKTCYKFAGGTAGWAPEGDMQTARAYASAIVTKKPDGSDGVFLVLGKRAC